MIKQSKKPYDKEFKENAVNLYLKSNRPYREIAKNLGIAQSTLASWVEAKKRDGEEAFPGKGHQKQSDAEVTKLRKELANVREERDILKKALGIFSSQRK
jgi:transposase